jgi:ElaB/YqjD/DUF883 family membrane-anchored ribosome-binding protein
LKKVEAFTMAYEPYEPRNKMEDFGRDTGHTPRQQGGQGSQAQETARGTTQRLKESGRRITESGRHLAENVREKAQEFTGRAGERLSEAREYVRDRASNVSRQVQHTATRTKDWVSETFDEYPLAFGGACVLLGMAAGFLIPASQPERRLVGQTGNRIIRKAQAVGSQLIDRGEEIAEHAVETVKGSVRGHGKGQSRTQNPPSSRNL